MALEVEITAWDGQTGGESVQVMLSYSILESGTTLLSSPAAAVPLSNGRRELRSIELVPQKAGLFTVLVTVEFSGRQEAGAATFRVD